MHLTPRETEKLMVVVAADLARRAPADLMRLEPIEPQRQMFAVPFHAAQRDIHRRALLATLGDLLRTQKMKTNF